MRRIRQRQGRRERLSPRTYDNPGIGGVDLGLAVQYKVENVFIKTGVYNMRASKPTHGLAALVPTEMPTTSRCRDGMGF